MRNKRYRESRVALVTTMSGSSSHRHVATFDDEGNGTTTFVAGHKHTIKGLDVLPDVDGHAHELTIVRVEYRIHIHRRTA